MMPKLPGTNLTYKLSQDFDPQVLAERASRLLSKDADVTQFRADLAGELQSMGIEIDAAEVDKIDAQVFQTIVAEGAKTGGAIEPHSPVAMVVATVVTITH